MRDPLWETPRELWTPQEKYEYRERRRAMWRQRYVAIGAAIVSLTVAAIFAFTFA